MRPRDRADQRNGDIAGLVDRIGIRQFRLFEDRQPDDVAAIEVIGLVDHGMEGGGRGFVGRAAGRDGQHHAKDRKSGFPHHVQSLLRIARLVP